MKNKKVLLIVTTLLMSICMLACGEEEDKQIVSATDVLVGDVKSNDEITTVETTATETKVEESIKDETTLAEENADMEVYENFLNGKSEVRFNTLLNQDWSNFYSFVEMNGDLKYVEGDTSLTYEGLLDLYKKMHSDYYFTDINILEVYKTYIDCGSDGTSELALNIKDSEGNEALIVIKEIEIKNNLQVIFWKEYGYRSYGTINEAGYYNVGGSNGANDHSTSYFYINGDGNTVFDYEVEEIYGTVNLYIEGNDEYEKIAEEQGISEDNFCLEQYSFDMYEDGDDYNTYQQNSLWTYYDVDDSYNLIDDDSVYNEDSPQTIFWKSTGLPFYTPDEINAKISENEQSKGISEEIKSAEEATWEEITD